MIWLRTKILIIFNNSGAVVSISITDHKGALSSFEASESSKIEVTNWTLNDPEITVGGNIYHYHIDIPQAAANWKGWWIFASSYINAQIEKDGTIIVLNKGVELPVKKERDILLTIKPEKNS